MFRISVWAGMALLFALPFGSASAARNCDERVLGSCAAEPLAEPADTNAGAANTVQTAPSVRANRERSYRRARRSIRYARHSRRAERRKAAIVLRSARPRAVAVAPAAEKGGPRAGKMFDARPTGETDVVRAPPQASAAKPESAPILPPAFTASKPADAANTGADPLWSAQRTEPGPSGTLEPPRAAAQPTASAVVAEAPQPQTAASAVPISSASVQPPATTAPSVASAPAEQADGGLLRTLFIALGGLLAAGSLARLFV
jgi:hypothetical protein